MAAAGAPLVVGILALQGAFAEHADMLRQLKVEPRLIRLPSELDELDGLILPGGESTTIGSLLRRYDFERPLLRMARLGVPILGTCAGMILLAREIDGAGRGLNGVGHIGAMDIVVRRNAFGRQTDSFETDLLIPAVGSEPFQAVFIRAPVIVKAGRSVTILAELSGTGAVAAEQENLLATAFHPELTADPRVHRYFLERVLLRRTGERVVK
jgi:5'-phosphate synthase pdxT subunit